MNKIKFAVVREDPIVEQFIIEKFHCQSVLLVASGGCLALSLNSMFPKVNFTLFDRNIAQINLVKNKCKLLENFDHSSYPLFNIGSDHVSGFNACGLFESLFRSFRFFIHEFIADQSHIEKIFLGDKHQAKDAIKIILQNKYWPVAFDLYFSDSMLITTFGQDAVQHAKPCSYPYYFQRALERGLEQPDFQTNYFLQHILLGYYVNNRNSWPYYLSHPCLHTDFRYIHDTLLNIRLDEYDFISLSNIFDWMSKTDVHHHLDYLKNNLKKGAIISFRQLNNSQNYTSHINDLKPNPRLERKLYKEDRSLFYEKLNILSKI